MGKLASKPVYRPTLMEDPRHMMRWLKAQAVGGSEEAAARAVAAAEGVSIQTARQSIREVDAYRKKNDRTEFDLAIRNVVISTAPKVADTLGGLLTATELVEVKNQKTGQPEVKVMEDKTTRLEATRVWNAMVAAQMPKVPMIENNISQTTQVATITGSETTEERLARLRKKAQEFNALPPEVAGVPEHLDTRGDDDDEDDGFNGNGSEEVE